MTPPLPLFPILQQELITKCCNEKSESKRLTLVNSLFFMLHMRHKKRELAIAARLEEVLRTNGDQLKDYKIQQLIAEIRGKEYELSEL